MLHLDLPIAAWAAEDGIDLEEVQSRIMTASDALMADKLERFGGDLMRFVEKNILLQTLDAVWKSICWRWTICARASACAPMASGIR